MAELLSRWINQDVGLSIPVQSFERDFANGYYFGELLSKLQLIGEGEFHRSFVNSSHPHTLTANLSVLGSLLKNMGIKFDAKFAKDIISGTAGASLRLLYQIKMAMQQREQQATSIAQPASKTLLSPMKGRTSMGLTGLPPVAGAMDRPESSYQPTGANALPPSLVAPKGHQATRPLDRLENRRLAENLLHMTHTNSKEKHMSHHLAKFEQQAQDQEEKQYAQARADDEARAQTLRANQLQSRDKLQQNQAYMRSWNTGGMQEWRQNMERIDATKAARSKWNSTVQHQAQERSQLHTQEKVHEVRSGIDEFERNLERIGAGSAASQANDEYATTDAIEVSAAHHITTKLAGTLGSPAQLAKQSAEHMAKIHDKCINDALARKERDRRRRKVLVEQSAQASALDAKKAEELFLEKLQKECAEERAIGEEVWRTEQYHAILAQNAAYRASQEAAVREEREQQTIRRNQSLYDSTKREHERQLASELARFEEIRLSIAAEKHEENLVYGQQLVQRIVDVAHKAACFREVSEQALIPPPMWREWMNLFVHGLPLLPERSASEADSPRGIVDAILASATTDEETNLRLEAGAPTSLLSALSLGEKKAPVVPVKASKDKAAAAAASAAELDSQSLTHEAFYESLYQNREVSSLVANLRDVNSTTAAVLDETALEDYLAGRNEWSYDIRSVAPPELVNDRDAAAAAAAASAATSPRPSSSSLTSSKRSLLDENTLKGKKGKADVPATPAEPEIVPFTSLSFLGPLHSSDAANLSEPLDASGSTVPANQNPLFGALLQRVLDVASGKEQAPDLPEVPRFPLAIVLLGKPFAGKQTQAALLEEKFGLKVVRPADLVSLGMAELDALEAAQAAEKLSSREKKGSSSERKSKAAAKSPYQLVLVKLKKLLVKSEPVPDDIMVALIVEHIKTLPATVAAQKAEQEAAAEARLIAATDAETGEVYEDLLGAEQPQTLVPGEGGFVLLNYPTTLVQARMLEQALSGFELPKPASAKSTGVAKPGSSKSSKVRSKVSRAVTPPPHEGPYPSAFDLVLRLDQDNDVLLRRARGQRVDPLTGRAFHLDYKQPTEADMNASIVTTPTGGRTEASNLQARLAVPAGAADAHAILPELFLTYEASEAELEEWFTLFGTLQVIKGSKESAPGDSSLSVGFAAPLFENVSIEETRERVRELVRTRMVEIDERKAREDEQRVRAAEQAAIANGEVAAVPTHPLETAALAAAAASLPADFDQVPTPVSPVPSGKKADKQLLDLEPVTPAYTYPLFTADELLSFSESGFYDLPLSELLSAKWIRCERNYISYSKHVFRALRGLRSQALEYFASTRRNFFTFLRRGDGKQALLDGFQAAFNGLPTDLRADVATKEELHMRLDELAEQVWRVNTSKHEENESEFARISGSGTATGQNEFLDHQLHSLFFYYALLMQLELDRYFVAVKIAQDFFATSKGHVIYDERERDEKEQKKLKPDLEIKTGEPFGVPIKGGLGLKLHINLPLTLSRDPKAKVATKKKETLSSSSSSSSTALGKKSSSKSLAGSGQSSARKRFAPVEVTDDPFAEIVEIIRAQFVASDEAVDQIAAQDLEALVASAGGAPSGKGKAKSAAKAASKTATSATPTTPSSPGVTRSSSAKKRGGKLGATAPITGASVRQPTREALLDAQLRELVTNENRLLSARIRRIHRNALLEMQQLRFYNEHVFLQRLDRFLELRIRGESGAIDSLLHHVRVHNIEAEAPILQHLRLEGENFFIDADVLNVPDPATLQPEFTPFSDQFDPLYATRLSLAQLLTTCNTLKSLCVGGVGGLDVKSAELYSLFLSQFHSAAGSSAATAYPIPGEQSLPIGWSPAPATDAVTRGVLQTTSVHSFFRQLVGLFAGASSDPPASSLAPTFVRSYVDFRDFLLAVALLDSVQTPTLTQLLAMQAQLTQLAASADGRVTWDEFSRVKLWLELGASGEEDELAPASQMESKRRTEEPVKRLKEFFFHLFAFEYVRPSEVGGPSAKVHLLSQLDFLLYLCFNDESASLASPSGAAASPHAPRSGLEKSQLLLANTHPSQWGELTQTFAHRYIHQTRAGHTSTTTQQEKFARKDLTRAT